jgi:hypothetical protein
MPVRTIVVVLGSGRSGTSLLMQVLAAMGMRVSEELIPARRDNPEGFYEDAPVVRIQADLLRALGAWPYHPLPAHWLDHPATAAAREALRDLLARRLAPGGLWGFKDPRTAAFLPLWRPLFAEAGIAPKYVLALREPGKIIQSFMRAYDTPAEVAEAVWLRRTCDALWHTRGACHIVHYEDWFSRPWEAATGLASHVGLPLPDKGVLTSLAKPGLDRSADSGYALASAAARTLHGALSGCRGRPMDPVRLLEVVAPCRPGTEVSGPGSGPGPGSVRR